MLVCLPRNLEGFFYIPCVYQAKKNHGPNVEVRCQSRDGRGGGMRHAVKRTLWSIRQTLIVNN